MVDQVEGGNLDNLLDMLNHVDIDNMSKVLKELDKYEKLIDKVSGLTMRLNKIGVLPAILRIAGQKSGVQNIDAPLPQLSPLSLEATSPTHLMMYRELNKQPEDTITAMFKQAVEIELQEKGKAVKKGKTKK